MAILLVALAVFLLTYKAPAKTRYVGDCGSLENTTFNTRCDGGALVFETCFNGTITEERTDCRAANQTCLTETVGNTTTAKCGVQPSATPIPSASVGPSVPPEYRGFENLMVDMGAGLVRAIDLPNFVPNSCGDGKCSVSETCLSCAKDCACKAGEKCRSNGLCSAPSCGDGLCEAGEFGACCTDCGCTTGICNNATRKCALPLGMQNTQASSYALTSLGNESAGYETETVYDDFAGNEPVKVVVLRCKEQTQYACLRVITIGANGEIYSDAQSG
ncbi:Uncharacterised protein [Candidatus Norongarragalina meridionalis]|nr:Uncharacterised protein [Candidatus Norongarragalina meridionalis]